MALATVRWSRNKRPAEVLDYGFDWAAELAATDPDDVISTSTWIIPAGLTAGAQGVTGSVTTVWISGGTDGADYVIVNRITTTGGRTHESSAQLFVKAA